MRVFDVDIAKFSATDVTKPNVIAGVRELGDPGPGHAYCVPSLRMQHVNRVLACVFRTLEQVLCSARAISSSADDPEDCDEPAVFCCDLVGLPVEALRIHGFCERRIV